MSKTLISEEMKDDLLAYLREGKGQELVDVYLHYLEKAFAIQPVLFPKEKTIYQNTETLIRKLEAEQKLYHEAEITIHFAPQSVNELTKRVYICPFSGKVFGDNTHPNPQDAIYDWVSKCPENHERVGGVKVKRFFVSEDPEVIQSYIPKEKQKEGVAKTVYSSLLSGKLFGSKKGVLDDFRSNYVRPMTIYDVQNQNRFQIEEGFLSFLQGQLQEDKVASFVEALAQHDAFNSYLEKWFQESE